eukprot:3214178-Prymnesium_polylepis.1
MARLPVEAAFARALSPLRSCTFALAPWSSSSVMLSTRPAPQAKVMALAPSLAPRFASAPASSRTRITDNRLRAAASIRGVDHGGSTWRPFTSAPEAKSACTPGASPRSAAPWRLLRTPTTASANAHNVAMRRFMAARSWTPLRPLANLPRGTRQYELERQAFGSEQRGRVPTHPSR